MGASLKRRTYQNKDFEIKLRPSSFDTLPHQMNRASFPKQPKNLSCDNILTYRQDHNLPVNLLISPRSEEPSYFDVTDNRFVVKARSYLRSLEQIGDISKLKFYYGHLEVKTEGEEELHFEVHDREFDLGEPLISLESEPNHNNLFFIYTYCGSAKGMHSRFTHMSMIYITDVHRSTSKCHLIQAAVNPKGQPILIPRRIRVPDNPKLTSRNSRFVGTLESDGLTRTMLLFVSKDKEPFYIAQSDMSLDLTSDDSRGVVLNFIPKHFE